MSLLRQLYKLRHAVILIMTFSAMVGCSGPLKQHGAFTIPVASDMSFRHYTLALTWQPGFCEGSKAARLCVADRSNDPLIGLHGLWASEPFAMEHQQIPVSSWWAKGCALEAQQDYASTSSLAPATWAHLHHIVPRNMPDGLIQHEYSKHMQCFNMKAEHVFALASTLRDRIAQGLWGRWLLQHVGQSVQKEDMLSVFQTAYGALPERGLQFRCVKDAQGRAVLSEMWFTLQPQALRIFPHEQAFVASPHKQDNCPSRIFLASESED